MLLQSRVLTVVGHQDESRSLHIQAADSEQPRRHCIGVRVAEFPLPFYPRLKEVHHQPFLTRVLGCPVGAKVAFGLVKCKVVPLDTSWKCPASH